VQSLWRLRGTGSSHWRQWRSASAPALILQRRLFVDKCSVVNRRCKGGSGDLGGWCGGGGGRWGGIDVDEGCFRLIRLLCCRGAAVCRCSVALFPLLPTLLWHGARGVRRTSMRSSGSSGSKRGEGVLIHLGSRAAGGPRALQRLRRRRRRGADWAVAAVLPACVSIQQPLHARGPEGDGAPAPLGVRVRRRDDNAPGRHALTQADDPALPAPQRDRSVLHYPGRPPDPLRLRLHEAAAPH
jgi:hypothetical protein